MIISFWHEPEEIFEETVEYHWNPNRTGSKKILNQNCWKEAEGSDTLKDICFQRIGKRFSITWDDENAFPGEVVCFYSATKKYKVLK